MSDYETIKQEIMAWPNTLRMRDLNRLYVLQVVQLDDEDIKQVAFINEKTKRILILR